MRALHEHQTRIGDALGDKARMALLYHIVGTSDDERRYTQYGKARRIDSRFVYHQAQELQLAFVAGSEGLMVLLVNFSARLLGEAVGKQVSTVKHKASNALGMLEREQQGDVGAIRKAQYVRRAYTEPVHEIGKIANELPKGERRRPARRFPMSARVNGNHTVSVFKIRYLVLKVRAVLAVAVQQYQGVAASALRIMKLDIHAFPIFVISCR